MITIYFGSPGCGKTTHIMYSVRKQQKAIKKYRRSLLKLFKDCPRQYYFTNVKSAKFPYYPSNAVGHFALPEDSIYYLDEAGIDYNNRKYKSLSQEAIEYFKLHRHYRHDINLYSQSWEDMDITLRRLADRLYYLRRVGPFTFVHRIRKYVTIEKDKHQIIDGYKFFSPLWSLLPSWLGGIDSLKIFFRPLYYKYFDSYDIPNKLPLYSTPQAEVFPCPAKKTNVLLKLIPERVALLAFGAVTSVKQRLKKILKRS